MEYDYLDGWIKHKMVTYKKISPKMINLRYKAGNTEKEVKQAQKQSLKTLLTEKSCQVTYLLTLL